MPIITVWSLNKLLVTLRTYSVYMANSTTIPIPISKEKSTSAFTLSDFNSRTNLTEKPHLNIEYIPSDHRDQLKCQSSGGALAHLIKSSLGSGILAMPMAFSNGGLIFSSIATLFVGIICTHCVHIVVKTSQAVCKDIKVPALNYAETAEKVFENGPKRFRSWSSFAKNFVEYGLMGTYFAAATVYIIFIATSLHDVVNYDFGLKWDIRIYIAMAVIPCLFIGQFRNLKYLVPFSTLANIFIVITFGIVLYYLFNQPLVFSDKPAIASITQIPLYFATVIFAMEGIGAVFPVENAMRKPQDFLGCPGVLNSAMTVVIVLYGVIGFFGYVRYGEEVRGSITLNLKYGEPLADVAKLLMAVAILFTYGLQFYIPNELLWRKINHKFDPKNHNRTQLLLRTGIILITGGIAAAVPNLEPFIGLVGAIFFSLLGILVPSVCETIHLWPHGLGAYNWRLYKNILLSIFAIIALLSGATASINDIIKFYTQE
ncbi:proton-coupled amino acid transporter-like protein CG1139 isoform X2 [Eurosta solidaginis]|uniref:proton-coupled amino acid transporter-like protein CG1139 isoform X2 n=1 Tax=Eurosta solidaginis TaxID=178769 RepID=UPI00353062B9